MDGADESMEDGELRNSLVSPDDNPTQTSSTAPNPNPKPQSQPASTPQARLASVSSTSSKVLWCSCMPPAALSARSRWVGGAVMTARLPGALSRAMVCGVVMDL